VGSFLPAARHLRPSSACGSLLAAAREEANMRPLLIVSIVSLLLTGCVSFREGYWQGRWETCIKQAKAQRLTFVHP